MDLGLDITRTRGRATKVPAAAVVRELRDSDIALLANEKGSKAPSILKLRESHHHLARTLALGTRPAEAALITGYSLSRISILQADPAFQDLLEVYREEKTEIFAETLDKMKAVHMDTLEIIHERLQDDPDSIKDADLIKLHESLADRTGFGPSSKSVNVNVNVELAARLQAARTRAGIGAPGSLPASQPPLPGAPATIEGEVIKSPPGEEEAA